MQDQTSSRQSVVFKWLAWFLLAITILCLTGIFILESLGCQILIDTAGENPGETFGTLLIPANAFGLSLLGTLIVTFRPDNRIGWLVGLLGSGLMAGMFAGGYGGCSLRGIIYSPITPHAIWFSVFILGLVFLGLVLFPLSFPDGHFLSPGWKRLGIIVISGYGLLTLLRAVWPGQIGNFIAGDTPIENPYSLNIQISPIVDSLVLQGGDLFLMIFFLVGIASLVLRYRGSTGEVRQQIKWLAYFLTTAGVLFIGAELIGMVFYPAIFDRWFYLIELSFFLLGFPLVIGLAVFKYRLYDIDIIIRRTLQYALLTILLGIMYFGVVILFQQLFRSGTRETAPLAIVISTLVIAALFNPLRRRVQEAIDRRFYRSKYDAQQALAAFAATAREEVELEQLAEELIHVVNETMHPSHTSLWLAERGD